MSREWKPGDVATTQFGRSVVDGGKRCRHYDSAPHWHHVTNGGWDPLESHPDARPLVVIDPEDKEAVERLAELVMNTPNASGWTDRTQAALREFANPTPPRIDEPGTWGVVEASCVHSDHRREWVRFPSGNWHSVRDLDDRRADIENPDDWDSLVDPVLVREGVQP